MFHCHLDPDPPTLVLQGDLTIEHASDIHAQMLAALPKEGRLTVELAADRVDSSFLQLLVALGREAERRGLEVRVREGGQGLVRDFFGRLGGERIWQTYATEVAP